MKPFNVVLSCVLIALLLPPRYVEASQSRKLLTASKNSDYTDLFDYLDTQKGQNVVPSNAAEPSDLPNAAAQQALLAIKAAWGGDFFGADTWVDSNSDTPGAPGDGSSEGAPAPSSQASPSEASPSEASPSEASPSEASPSEASPSEASPSKPSPSQPSPTQPAAATANGMGVGELGMGFGNMGLGSGGLGPGDLWRGVGIDLNGDVVSLELPESGVSGPFPLELSQLTSLTALDLGGNNLSGVIPAGVFASLPLLSEILLNGNSLEGGFPWNEVFTQANSPLMFLRLDDNNFVGELRDNVFENATQLHSLTLCGNKFTGPIPSSLGSASEISIVDLSTNWFTGSVPPSLADKPALEVLTLSHNRLSGEIPAFLGKLPAIVNLDLSHNWFIGRVPASFSSFGQSLRALTLSYNALTGPLPRFTGLGKECEDPQVDSVSCYRFEVLIDLSANYFEGRADMVMQMPGSESFPKPTWVCPSKDYTEQISVSGNCLVSSPGCEAVDQRKDETCAKFCGTGSKEGQCGGAGVCIYDPATVGPNAVITCLCNKGYQVDPTNPRNCVKKGQSG
ncbi:hypothetical protein CLOM_g3038 [Closterium sp. NIES-68]|nr:hypothetical protein CLOM_g3038 [Closterium sp. NIES-68]GJP73517.1 hypothetical protein CLOP_g4221 [Closterium sp. NIES-67]